MDGLAGQFAASVCVGKAGRSRWVRHDNCVSSPPLLPHNDRRCGHHLLQDCTHVRGEFHVIPSINLAFHWSVRLQFTNVQPRSSFPHQRPWNDRPGIFELFTTDLFKPKYQRNCIASRSRQRFSIRVKLARFSISSKGNFDIGVGHVGTDFITSPPDVEWNYGLRGDPYRR